MFYLIYKITNNLNNKIYVGSHKTKNKDDGYMGSGKYLNHAINKYGVENFIKEILFVFDNAKEMYDKEAEIVNDNFLAEENTYNLKRGGFGGFDYINANNLSVNNITVSNAKQNVELANKAKAILSETDPLWKATYRINLSNALKGTVGSFIGKTHTDITKAKQSASHKGKCTGSANSQYGTCWVMNIPLQKNLKINKDLLQTYLSDGWLKGRKIKF